ncbi:hypothetical protein RRG08_046577 [Elysia crispata]|uniref:Uncharacterized protein n=1 Tax=Elysia crispata TaxID=231223 RepID=A0AAE1APM6_9GAST|nr:hypothetical protein RRG08_046577 [Elysia crispata]
MRSAPNHEAQCSVRGSPKEYRQASLNEIRALDRWSRKKQWRAKAAFIESAHAPGSIVSSPWSGILIEWRFLFWLIKYRSPGLAWTPPVWKIVFQTSSIHLLHKEAIIMIL